MTMWLYEERSSVSPYGAPDQRTMLNGVVRAVQIACSMSTGLSRSSGPREEDIQHDIYRPYWCDRMSAGLDEKGDAGYLEQSLRGLLGHGAMAPSGVKQWPRPRHAQVMLRF